MCILRYSSEYMYFLLWICIYLFLMFISFYLYSIFNKCCNPCTMTVMIYLFMYLTTTKRILNQYTTAGWKISKVLLTVHLIWSVSMKNITHVKCISIEFKLKMIIIRFLSLTTELFFIIKEIFYARIYSTENCALRILTVFV